MSWSFNPFTGNLDLVGSGGGTVVFEGEVPTFADLPVTVGDPAIGAAYLVRDSTGVWLVNRRQAGIYIRRNNAGLATDWEYGGDYPVTSVNGETGAVTLDATDVGAAPTVHTHPDATALAAGFLSVADKNKLDSAVATTTFDPPEFSATTPVPYFNLDEDFAQLFRLGLPDIRTSIPRVQLGGTLVLKPSRDNQLNLKYFQNQLEWSASDNNDQVFVTLRYSPTLPYFGSQALATLRRYYSYDNIGVTSPTGQPTAPQFAQSGGTVPVQGGGSRKVMQFFTAGGTQYAYVVDYPSTGNAASGPEQLELWTATTSSFATANLIAQTAVLGPTINFSFRPTTGGHLSSFKIVQTTSNSDGDYVSIALLSQITGGGPSAVSQKSVTPVWNYSWTNSMTVANQGCLQSLSPPNGPNQVLAVVPDSDSNYDLKWTSIGGGLSISGGQLAATGSSGGFSREPATGSNAGLVQWANSGFDTTGGFDVANNRFVVPTGKAGLYAFNAAIYYDLPSDTQVELGIYVNNLRVRAFYTGTFDGTQGQAQVFGIIPMEENDVVTVRVNFFGDQNAAVRSDNGVSWFTGVQL